MKILKLLNKKNFLILIISIFFFQESFSTEPVDIWKIEDQKNEQNNISSNDDIESDNSLDQSVYEIISNSNDENQVNQEEELLSKKIDIVGIYDPSENDLSIDMWTNSNGEKILEIISKLEKLNLSKDASNILNISLLTNSYIPEKNITNEEFLKIKSDWLLKQKNLDLIEIYLIKNKNLKNNSDLIKYYVNYYLSRSDLKKSCDIFNNLNMKLDNNYLIKFKIYCLINSNKNEEAQLYLDLFKEEGFEDNFFEKKFFNLIGYEEEPNVEISEETLLDFHLSHRTNQNFVFEPKIDTNKLIWKYLSYSNLLENIDLVDLEDQEKLDTIEMATHEKNYEEEELYGLYERYKFNINQLLTVEESHKLLSRSESRALIYQGILITKDTPEKIKLIKMLKDSFQSDEITNAFDLKLEEFLKQISEEEIPSNYTNFYKTYKKTDKPNDNKIKFNNKIIHQSKILNYFKNDLSVKDIEKDLESLLKKIKKDKKYFFSIKDIILLESLKSDGYIFKKKYEKLYEPIDPNIPYDIQILINKDEIGLALLRLVQIIGEDKIEDIDPETFYFIISVLNQLNLDRLRNVLLLKVLPLKV